jgi:hypothetical protein
MPTNPIVSRELGLVSAVHTCDGRRKGVAIAEAAARLRNERRETDMVFSFLVKLSDDRSIEQPREWLSLEAYLVVRSPRVFAPGAR